MKLDDFAGSFTEDHGKHGAQSPFLLHFRIATHGNIDVTNVHPFTINPRCVFAHNGIFTGLGGVKEERSDTRVFAEEVLRFLPHNFIRNPGIVRLIDEYCGGYNKLVFLNARREYLIINEEGGEWSKDGNWYSNQSYMGGYSRYPVQTFRSHSADEWYDEQWWSRYSSIQPTSASTRKTCVICLDEDNTEGYNDQYKICLYCQRSIAQLCHCELADVKPELLGLSTFTMIATHPSYDFITEGHKGHEGILRDSHEVVVKNLMNPHLDELLKQTDRVMSGDGAWRAEPVPYPLPIVHVGVDLRTAYTVLVVLDEHYQPIAGEYQFAQVTRDGLVVDFIGAVDLLRAMKSRVEKRLGFELATASTGYPPGVPQAEVRATANVLYGAGLDCTGLIDEPTAANNVLQIQDGAIVDVGD